MKHTKNDGEGQGWTLGGRRLALAKTAHDAGLIRHRPCSMREGRTTCQVVEWLQVCCAHFMGCQTYLGAKELLTFVSICPELGGQNVRLSWCAAAWYVQDGTSSAAQGCWPAGCSCCSMHRHTAMLPLTKSAPALVMHVL